MAELFYPTIDLFIYDLRSPLNDSAETEDNLQLFKQRFPQDCQQLIHDIEAETEYYNLLPPIEPFKKPIFLQEAVNTSLEKVQFQPIRLNDTYGLRVDCSVNNITEPQSIDSFRQIQTEIKPYSDAQPSVTIGRTWLVSGWLTEDTQDPEVVAKECYKVLFSDNQWTEDLYGKGNFLQGTIWELWRPSQLDHHNHIVVLLFKDGATAEKAASFHTDWMGLFCYRHKITWAYNNSRLIKESLVNHYKKVENNAKIIEKSQTLKIDLKNLQQNFNEIQTVLNQYTANLLELAFQKETIEINLSNYQTRLELIKQKIQKTTGEENNLAFFNKFIDLTEKKYIPQIVRDNNNMQLGLQLLQSNINALRSQIELEKSGRDRNFQNLVTVVGSGTAIAAYLDFKGEKCQAIFKRSKKAEATKSTINSQNQAQDYPDFCNNFWIGSFLVPISFLIIVGSIGFALKTIIQKIN